MDGAASSGGFSGGGEIAASWVTVGADMSGLRAAEQESRAIVERIGQMTATVGMGGGGSSSSGFAPSGPTGTVLGTPSAGTGAFSMASPSFGTIGGGGFVASGSATPSFGANATFSGGGASGFGGIDIASHQQAFRAAAGEVQQLRDQLDLLMRVKSQFTAQGGAPPIEIPEQINNLRSTLREVGKFTAPPGMPFHAPTSAFFSSYENPAAGMGLAEPGEAFTAPIDPFSMAPIGAGRQGRYGRQSARMRDFYGALGEPPEPLDLAESEPGFRRVVRDRNPYARERAEMQARGIRTRLAEQMDALDEAADYEAAVGPEATAAADAAAARNRALSRRAGRAFGSGIYGIGGFIAREIGVPIASVIAGEEALNIAGAYDRASVVASQYQGSLDNGFGSIAGLFGNPNAVQAARAIAGASASEIRMGAWESLPLIGGLVRGSNAYDHAINAAITRSGERVIQGETFLAQQRLAEGVRAADLTGTSVDVVAARIAANEAPLAAEAGRTKLDIGRENPNAPLSELNRQWAQVQRAQQMLATVRANDAIELDIANREHGAMLSLNAGSAESGRLMGASFGVLAAGGAGAAEQALGLRQRAEMNTFYAQAGADLAKVHNPEDRASILNRLSGQRIELEGKQGKELSDLLKQGTEVQTQLEAESYRARLEGTRNFYQAQLAEVNEGERQKVAALTRSGASADDIAAAHGLGAAGRESLFNEAEFSSGQAVGAANSSIVSAGLRSGRRFFQAQLNDFDTSQLQAIARMDTSGPFSAANVAAAYRQYQANRGAMLVGHAQELQMEREDYATQSTVANDVMGYSPITARADAAIARARRMVETASPEARNSAIAAGRDMLRAQIHELTAQRGGETAIDMSLGEALGTLTGSGIDLTGRLSDIRKAGRHLQGGINDLPGASLTDAPPMDPEAKQLFQQMVTLLTQLVGKSGVIALFK